MADDAQALSDIIDRLDELVVRVVRIESLLRSDDKKLDTIATQETAIMVTMQDIQAKAQAELTQITAETDIMNAVKMVVDNQNTKLTDLQMQIAALQAAGTPPSQADLQALSDTIDAIKAADTSNAAIVSKAVAAGTPIPPTS